MDAKQILFWLVIGGCALAVVLIICAFIAGKREATSDEDIGEREQ